MRSDTPDRPRIEADERGYRRELGLHRDVFERVERSEVGDVVDTEHMREI